MSTPLDDDSIITGDVIEAVHITQLFPIVQALEDNQTNYREDTGAADAYKVDFSGSGNPNEIDDYQAGQQIVFKAAHTNTGSSTLQITGPSGDLSAKALKKFGNQALQAGDIQADQIVMAVYNDEGSGRFEVVGSPTTLPAPPDPEDGSGFYRADTGAADAYAVDASGGGSNPREISSLAKGQIFTFKAAHANTGASTLEVTGPSGSLGVKSITKRGDALVAGDIQANQLVTAVYSDQGSGRFELLSPTALDLPDPEDGSGFFRADTGAADAYEVDASGGGSNPRAIAALVDGQLYTFKAEHTNTGGSTLHVIGSGGSLGTKAITRRGQALVAGDILADSIIEVIFNASEDRFELVGEFRPEDGTGFHHEGGGAANAYSVTADGTGFNPRPVSNLENGLLLTFKAVANNTGASTLEVVGPGGSFGTFDLTKRGGALDADDIVADAMVAVLYSDEGSGRFELLGSIPSSSGGGGGGGGSPAFHGCQSTLDSDVQIFANSETDIHWDTDDISEGLSNSSEWIFVDQSGYYEVSLVLAMEMTDPDSLTIQMQKYHSSSSWTVARNEIDVAAGLMSVSFDPVIIYLENEDGVKWMVTSSLGDPTIKSGDLRTRCSIKFLSGAPTPVCMVSVGNDIDLEPNSEVGIGWDGDQVDPYNFHDGGSEWVVASEAGFYEVGLVLSMEMTAAESMQIRLVRDAGMGESTVSMNEVDAPAGLNMFTLTPVLVELAEGEQVAWKATATLDYPTIRAHDFRSRASFKFLGPSS